MLENFEKLQGQEKSHRKGIIIIKSKESSGSDKKKGENEHFRMPGFPRSISAAAGVPWSSFIMKI